MAVAQSLWSANVQINCACEVRILRDGSVEVLSSVQDIGTGIGTVMAQVVAEVLGLRSDQITVRIGDTDFPAGPPSHGSRTTASITPAARTAASHVLQSLFREAALAPNAAPEQLIARDGRILVRDDPGRNMQFAAAAARLRTDRISAVASRSDDYAGFRRRMEDLFSRRNNPNDQPQSPASDANWTYRCHTLKRRRLCGRWLISAMPSFKRWTSCPEKRSDLARP